LDQIPLLLSLAQSIISSLFASMVTGELDVEDADVGIGLLFHWQL
jgi:hypothetical protein